LIYSSHSWIYKLDSFRFSSTVIIEIFLFSIILYILHVRGLYLSDFNLDISVKLIGVGILLFFINNITYGIIFSIIKSFVKLNTLSYLKFNYAASFISALSILIVNSFYEEFLLNGYIFKRFENQNTNLIIIISVVLRVSYHTYQGWIGFVGVLIVGLVFSIYYSKYKKLWPVIIAHGLINLTSFYSIHHHLTQIKK
jgi:membrane protease YdiL (CAAX protease family)